MTIHSVGFQASAISLLYLTMGVGATILLVLTGDNSYFRPAHMVFMTAITLLAFTTNIASVLISRFLTSSGGMCLLGFFGYYLIMALGYPDDQVSMGHVRYLFSSVLPGFLVGFVAFGDISAVRFREIRALPLGLRRFLAAVPTAIAISAYTVLIVGTFVLLLAIRRPDIFLITNLLEDDDIAYQLFGTYMLLAYCVGLALTYKHYARHDSATRRFLGFITLQIAIAALVGTSLALMGSTKELIALILILLLTVISAKPKNWILRGLQIRVRNAVLLLAACVSFGGIIAWYVLDSFALPPLALFGFQDNAHLLEHPSLVSRMQIMLNSGFAQLSLNPILGDLGAEYVFGGPGQYVHSLVSVQTHLGALGSVCLAGFLLQRLKNLYATDGYEALKAMAPVILFIAMLATFFVWMPFWFLIGALFALRTPRRKCSRATPAPPPVS